MKSFYDYFAESSESCGVPAPKTIFAGLTGAAAFLAACIKAAENFKIGIPGVVTGTMTVRMLFQYIGFTAARGATAAAAGEVLVAVGGCTAAWCLGVWTGALVYATSQSIAPNDLGMGGFFEWYYDVPEKEREYQQMQARLAQMKKDRIAKEVADQARQAGIAIKSF